MAVFDRNGEAADEAAAKIAAAGGTAAGVEVDVTDRPGIDAAVVDVRERARSPHRSWSTTPGSTASDPS